MFLLRSLTRYFIGNSKNMIFQHAPLTKSSAQIFFIWVFIESNLFSFAIKLNICFSSEKLPVTKTTSIYYIIIKQWKLQLIQCLFIKKISEYIRFVHSHHALKLHFKRRIVTKTSQPPPLITYNTPPCRGRQHPLFRLDYMTEENEVMIF